MNTVVPSKQAPATTGVPAAGDGAAVPPVNRGPWVGLAIALAVILAAFSRSLYELFIFAGQSTLYSHIPLIPAVSGYMAWIGRRGTLAGRRFDPALAGVFAAGGAALLVAQYFIARSGTALSQEDRLFLQTLAAVLFVAGAVGGCLGRAALKALSFPLTFLVFMIPLPSSAVAVVENVLQHGSAWVALGLFRIWGTPVYNSSLVFQLPGFTMEVAPECSGIHSSLALLITAIVAGRFFLRSNRNRLLLALLVAPLALLRNGFRVFTIGELCVNIGPHMIDSYLHRRGGPIFFALSLIPFAAALYVLARSETRSVPMARPLAPTS